MKRREFIKSSSMAGAAAMLVNPSLAADKSSVLKQDMLLNTIPKSGKKLAIIGMGTYRNLNISDTSLYPQRVNLLKTFFELGGEMLDSSPMYGQSEKVIGHCLKKMHLEDFKPAKKLFSTTKVWTQGKQAGIEQMRNSLKLWDLDSFNLMQIHNLVDWTTHLSTLRDWQGEGIVEHIGITTSHGRHHSELEKIMKTEALDFIQLTYNIRDREVENRLLPLAADKGIAVIINRPFNGLFGYTKDKPLPSYANELGCKTWAQFYLKFVISHPAVTCVIPATSKEKHLRDNMSAGRGLLPDTKTRKEMIKSFSQFI